MTDERIVWLIVSPVLSAEEMIAVPSMSPRTMSVERAGLRATLRAPSFRKTRLRTASAATVPSVHASTTTSTSASVPIGIPKRRSTASS